MNQLHLVILRMMTVFVITIFSLTSYSQSHYAVSLDGIDDYVSLSTSAAVSQSNTFTVEGWVYWNGTGNGCIYSETIQGNDNPMLSISPRAADGGGIELVFRDNSLTGLVLQPAAATITANIWVHVAIVRTSATNIKTYINGVLKDDATFSAPAAWTPTQVNAGIRWRASQDGPFAGKINELRIWNTARTQAEIKANMFNKNLSNSATGLVAYYKMDDATGTTATNSCTNTSGIDGTLTNGPTWSTSPVQFGGNALHFDQVDDRVVAPLATTATSNATMELWVNHEGGTGTDHLLVSNGVMGTNGYALYINTQRKLCVQYNAVGTWNTNYVVPSNTWTHIALVIDASGFTVYANGANVYSNTATPVTPTGNFILGYNTVANGQPYDGMMDEVRVWNTARTQTEIQNAMNTEIDPSTAGLALYYTFDQGIGGGTNTGLSTVIDQSGTNNGTLTNFALSGATSNYLTQNSGLSVLPLKWLSFTAQAQGETVLLQWSTSSEVNTGDFTVEHQTKAGDWQSIGVVRSEGGNDNAVHSYTFKHTSPSAGMNYYRIKQTDIDGRSGFSTVRSIEVSHSLQSFRVIANPVSNKILQIKVDDVKGQMISLFTYDGRLVWKKKIPAGVHSIQLNQLAEGVYVVDNGLHSEKILVH